MTEDSDYQSSDARFIESWLEGQLSPQTRRAYRVDLSQFFEFFGSRRLDTISREDILRYRRHLADSYTNPGTVNRHLSTVRAMFAEAVSHRLIDRSPAEGVKGFKADPNPRRLLAPTNDEIWRLLNSVSGDSLPDLRDRAMIYVLIALGLRRAEVVELMGSSVSIQGDIVRLTIIGKGRKERRERLPKTAAFALGQWMKAAKISPDDPLFRRLIVNKKGWRVGRGLTGDGVWHILETRMSKAGLTGYSPHSLRRFFITHGLSPPIPTRAAQQLFGHAST